MVSTVLHEKKGVITEDRFQKMTPAQWLFHFIEIMENKGTDDKVLLNLMEAANSTLSRDIRILYTLTGDNKEQIMQALDIASELDRKARGNKEDENKENKTNESPLKEEDKELLEFMYSTPKTIKMPSALKQEISYVLDAQDITQILDDFTELPDKENIENKNLENEEIKEEKEEVEENREIKQKEIIIVDSIDDIKGDIDITINNNEEIEEF